MTRKLVLFLFGALFLAALSAGTFAVADKPKTKAPKTQSQKNAQEIKALRRQVATLLKIVMQPKRSKQRAYVYRCSPKVFEQKVSAPPSANGPSRTETACEIPLRLSQDALIMASFSGHGCHYRKTSGMCWVFIDFGEKSRSLPAGASWVGDHRAWALSGTRIRHLPKGKHKVRLRLQASPGAGCHLGNGVLYVAVLPGAKKASTPSVTLPQQNWACPAKPANKKALHDAVGKGETATIECYLKRNATNATTGITVGSFVDNQRNITLHLAAERCNPAMIKLLMRYGGYGFINATNKYGRTPYAIAKATCRGANQSEVLRLLSP